MKKEFPAMIYHIQLGQRVVKNKLEMAYYEGQGWITNYRVYQEKNNINEKINYHLTELKKLEAEKEKMIVTKAKSVTISDKPTGQVEQDKPKPVAKPEKRRGRPRKEA